MNIRKMPTPDKTDFNYFSNENNLNAPRRITRNNKRTHCSSFSFPKKTFQEDFLDNRQIYIMNGISVYESKKNYLSPYQKSLIENTSIIKKKIANIQSLITGNLHENKKKNKIINEKSKSKIIELITNCFCI